jgi:sugar phosphate isomerase/epimerase
MRFAVFTASTPEWTPQEAATALAAQGWDGIEWRVTDQDDAPHPGFWAGNRATWPLTGLEDNVAAMARVARDAGLECSAVGGYAPAADHANVERLLAATAALGAHRLRVWMPATGTGHYGEVFEATRRDVEWAVTRAAQHDVQVLIELHNRTIVASASAALRLVDGLDPAHVGVIHDVGNLVVEGYEDALSAFQLLGPYLAHVHVKNAAWERVGQDGDGAVLWESRWVPLREGQADLAAYFGALHAHGYDGWVTVEDFSTAVPLAERTRDNLAYVRELSARAAGAARG